MMVEVKKSDRSFEPWQAFVVPQGTAALAGLNRFTTWSTAWTKKGAIKRAKRKLEKWELTQPEKVAWDRQET